MTLRVYLRKASSSLKQMEHRPSLLMTHRAWKAWSHGNIQTSLLSNLLISLPEHPVHWLSMETQPLLMLSCRSAESVLMSFLTKVLALFKMFSKYVSCATLSSKVYLNSWYFISWPISCKN